MDKKVLQDHIIAAVNEVREKNPVAGSFTNCVTINFVANAQLAVGGSAAMAFIDDQSVPFASMGQSLYINLGTLFPVSKDAMVLAAKTSYEQGKKWVLDPVGLSMGNIRGEILAEMKKYKPGIVRGNASEIITLASMWNVYEEMGDTKARGVDSTNTVEDAREAAIALAKYIDGAVMVSGKEDLITDGKNLVTSQGGSHYMEKVTGCGCSLGGVVAIYATVTDPFTAAVTAANIYNVAGARAEAIAKGPGSFQMEFIDQLYLASAQDVAENPMTVEEI